MKSVVYFAQMPAGGPIKIGHSTNWVSRLRSLCVDFPCELVLIGKCPGGLFRERFVQSWFRAHQMRGEWFEPTAELWRWAMEAASTNDISAAPPELRRDFQADCDDVNRTMHFWKIQRDEVAEAAGIKRVTLDAALDRNEWLTSFPIMAAVSVVALRKKHPIDWTDMGTPARRWLREAKLKARIASDIQVHAVEAR